MQLLWGINKAMLFAYTYKAAIFYSVKMYSYFRTYQRMSCIHRHYHLQFTVFTLVN